MHVQFLAKSLTQSKNSINIGYYFVSIIGQTSSSTWCPRYRILLCIKHNHVFGPNAQGKNL